MIILTVMSLGRVSVLWLVIVRVILVVLTVMSFDRVSVLWLVIVRFIIVVLTVMSFNRVSVNPNNNQSQHRHSIKRHYCQNNQYDPNNNQSQHRHSIKRHYCQNNHYNPNNNQSQYRHSGFVIGYCRVIMIVLTVISLDRVSVLWLVIVGL
jgi:ABC-type nickel/cobalt efflux system permease component RcnA